MENEELIRSLIVATRQRARRELFACLIILVCSGAMIFVTKTGSRQLCGWLVLVVAALLNGIVTWKFTLRESCLHRHPAFQTAFWTRMFLAQARLLRWVPVWYLAPLVLGLILISVPARGHRWSYVQFIFVVMIAGSVSRQNRKAAESIEAQSRQLT